MGTAQSQTLLCPTCPVALLGNDPSFDDLYEVDDSKALGTGKFSSVYLCWRRDNPTKRYALKVIELRPEDHATLTRIYEEIEIMRVLGNHPSLIQLVDLAEAENCIKVVLELCEGGELYARIHQKQCYPEAEAKVLMRQLLEAVAYIHSKGIMHRDLKPENILLSSTHNHTDIKVSDFGLAKQSKDYPRRLPRSHSICGSDFYLAPEVIKQDEYGREIDIWAVGVVCYVLLSGSLPFFHTILHKLYRSIVERDLSFPEAQWGHVSQGGKDFVLRLLQCRAGDRLTAEQALNHPWLRNSSSPNASFSSAPNLRQNSNGPYATSSPGSWSTAATAPGAGWNANPGYGYPTGTQPMPAVGETAPSLGWGGKGY
jgi:calcium/calmodulin-dependent protein kinase I